MLSDMAQLVPLSYSQGSSTRYSDRLHDFSVATPRCYKDVYVNSFFPRTARLLNSLAKKCFPLTYDLIGFKSKIHRINPMPRSGCLALHGADQSTYNNHNTNGFMTNSGRKEVC